VVIKDQVARDQAIDPTRSFCVSAPAGSGKTELLTQRLLALLARVERPEQVLAITFTRKAASEMAHRVLEKIEQARTGAPTTAPHESVTRRLAEALLAHADKNEWRLDERSLNLRTIDSFCHELTRQMPILSGMGGAVEPVDDAQPLYEEAVRSFLSSAGEGAAGEGICRLLLQFENRWSRVAEMLVALLERRGDWGTVVGQHQDSIAAESAIRQTLRDLTELRLSAIADMLGSHVAILERLVCDARENLDLPPISLLTAHECIADWRAAAQTLLTKEQTWRKPGGVNKNLGFPAGSEIKSEFVEVLESLSGDDALREALAEILLIPLQEQGDPAWDLVVLVSSLLPALQAHLLVVFQESGAVDHTHVTLAALQALGTDDEPTRLAERLDYQIEHILIDEFQDTSASQALLLERITRGWHEHNENSVMPRTLFVVGDAMQSIYGFRDADVSLFLQARKGQLAGLSLESLELTENFRSRAPLIDWVNETFSELFGATDQPNYGRVRHVWASHSTAKVNEAFSGVKIKLFNEADCGLEGQYLANKIAAVRERSPDTSIAVLVRTRSQAKQIASVLRAAQVPFTGDAVQGLSENSAVMDLLSLTRWLINPADNVAALSLLRSPWCGLGLKAISQLLAAHDERPFDLLAVLSSAPSTLTAEDCRRVRHLEGALCWASSRQDRLALAVWLEQIWLRLAGPQCCNEADRLAIKHFFKAVSAAEEAGVGLEVAWLERHLQTISDGQADNPASIQIMTLHKAKGLEFDYVFLPMLCKKTRGLQRDLVRWHWQELGSVRVLMIAANDGDSAAQSVYNYLNWLQKRKDHEELKRLLYVGVTRAKVAAYLSGSVTWESSDEPPALPEGSLLSVLAKAGKAMCSLEYISPDPTEGEGSSLFIHDNAASTFKRLPLDALTPLQDMERTYTESVASNPDFAAIGKQSNRPERVIGMVVHRVFELLAREEVLPKAGDGRVNHWIKTNIHFHSLPPAQAQSAFERSERLVSLALSCEVGRWILNARSEAYSELELTRLSDNEVTRHVVDRTFYDEASGIRWVIDFKTSEPAEGESLSSFEAREHALYGPQLENYAALVADFPWVTNAPIQKALYYPGIQHLALLNA
jgi:ATP-dependent helicase/nuclease subunit A